MLKRIYVNNFRCLVNFELTFDNVNLILGHNGSGKSTLFDVIRKLQQFIIGDLKIEDICRYQNLTK
ncbi:MAG: AAA family ATPase [Cyanobacteria bacterium J06621_12]